MCVLMMVILTGMAGCIRSRVHINSNPQGANVTLNQQPYGPTPVDIPFIWYWYYDIKLEKEGYATIEDEQKFKTPIWAFPPLDLFAEALPFPIPDNRHLDYQLQPASPVDSE